MRNIWIIVSDGEQAQIFSKREGADGLSAVQKLDNPHGRARSTDLVANHLGQFGTLGRDAKSAKNPPVDPHVVEARNFAMTLNQLLDSADSRGAYDGLVLVAAPFLGMVRSGLRLGPKKRLMASLENDLTHLELSDLENRLKSSLHLHGAQVH